MTGFGDREVSHLLSEGPNCFDLSGLSETETHVGRKCPA